VGEYLDKARRIEAREEAAGATERALLARMGEAAFWEYRSWAEREALAWRERLAGEGSAGDDAPGEVPAAPPATDDPASIPASKRTAVKGARLLGIGVAVGGLCALAQLGELNPLVFGVTVGVVLVLVGLVYLLVAAVQRASERSAGKLDEEGRLLPQFRTQKPPEPPEPPPPPPRPPGAEPDPPPAAAPGPTPG
jgi:hypothetical protein